MLLLEFSLADQRYALDTGKVLEIIPKVSLRQVPHAPRCVAGLLSYRGAVVPVIDLCALLADRPCEPVMSSRIILVDFPTGDNKNHVLGLIAERVTDTAVDHEPELLNSGLRLEEAPYLGEILHKGREMIQCLHVEHLLPESLRESLFASPER